MTATASPDKSETSVAAASNANSKIQPSRSVSSSRTKSSPAPSPSQLRPFARAPSSAPLSFGISSVGSSGSGFFSLGESNIADRAKRLKEERNNKNAMNQKAEKNVANSGSLGGVNNDNASVVSMASKDGNASIVSVASKDFEKASLHEFDSLLISNQAGETENILHDSLVEGFRGLRENRILQAYDHPSEDKVVDASSSAATAEQRRFYATVNFIDPTTKPNHSAVPSSAPPILSSNPMKSTNLLQQQSMLSRRVASNTSQASAGTLGSVLSPLIENVYENLTHIFEKEYGSTIRSVQYKNNRTGEVNTIRKLPIRPVITMNGSRVSGGRGAASPQEATSPNSSCANIPWGGTVSTALQQTSDPSEWHTAPFCHVYIAACENVDHYRTKVRPSLKAFVSQLESTESNTAANQQGGHSADYLIVYIPIGDRSNNKKESSTPSASSNKNNTNPGGRLGFFGIGRRNNQTSDAQGENDDTSSKGSVDSGDERMDMSGTDDDSESGATINVLMTFNHLSKNERTLYKKIVSNFPNGKVCVLSTPSLERVFVSEEAMAIRVMEWNVFNRLLGQVIVNGFQDRINRYKAELKRLDAQRATAATAAKNYASKGSISSKVVSTKPNPYAFNLSHFFLVKESLASSYEQMQLPGEALLQYDEFRLYMPDLSDRDESKVRKARRKSKALLEDSKEESLSRLADAADFLGFRKKIRTEYDLTAILDIMRRYLFARELSLLFRMEQPVEVLSRCQSFIKVMYSIILRGISELDEKNRHERKSKAATWVVQFSWDIYRATKAYLDGLPPLPTNQEQLSNQNKRNTQSDEAVSAKLSEILEVSRLFLLQLAEDHAETLESFSVRRKNPPKDLQTPWHPWTPYDPKSNLNGSETNATTNDLAITGRQNDTASERQLLMTYEDTLASVDKFEEAYIHMCGAIIDARQAAKHHRLSARIQAEVGEYYASKGDLYKAAKNFQKIVKMYRVDHWDRCHFWRVFRLAYCQRTSVEPTAYLKTLCSCFSPRSAVAAPKKALAALFDDLQRVIEHPSIGNARYSRLLFIETSISISTASDRSQMVKLSEQKDVEKRFCSVGESLRIPISIKNHLPGPIELTSVKLFAVAASTFKRVLANGDAVQEEDAAKVLSITTPIKLNPGMNEFAFEWSPPKPGQYILSTVEILWKEGYFYYDSMDLQEPLLSIDVVRNEPTHSISMEPAELVPGHDQEVKIVFEAGSDFIASAKLILLGSNDILLMPPGEDPSTSEWRQEWKTDLDPCKPGEKRIIAVHVRCRLDPKDPYPIGGSEDNSVDPVRGLVAKALTTYVYAPTKAGEEADPTDMEVTAVEAFAPVLEKTALSVESVETYWLEAPERFLLSVVLNSNAACHLVLDEWNLKMASPITLSSSGTEDVNENLLQRSVWGGDQLSFAFECSIDQKGSERASSSSKEESKMNLKLCDDEGKKFSIDLPLDLSGFCSRLPVLDFFRVPKTSTVPATLSLEKNRGLVGEPLEMTFMIDTSGYESSNPTKDNSGRFVYSIGCKQGLWLLGGKVSGTIDCSGSQTLSCVGVPVIPGVLEHFPTVTLELLDPSSSSALIHVECQQPEVFQSMPMTQVNAIATPRYEERQ